MPEMHLTTRMCEEQPKFMALLCIGLLYKLAGQQTLDIQELHDYNKEFDGIRVSHEPANDKEPERVIVTLHRPEEVGATA